MRDNLGDFSSSFLHSTADREIFDRLLECEAINELESSLDDTLRAHLHTLIDAGKSPAIDELDAADYERAFVQCMNRIKQRHKKQLQMDLVSTAVQDSSTPPPRELAAQISTLNEGIRATELHHQTKHP